LNGLVADSGFVSKMAAPEVEKRTILGPFFRISPLQTEVTRVYFAAPRTMEPSRIKTSQEALQITLAAHQTDLKNIVNALIRASTDARNRTLDWFAYIMNVNHKRRAIQVDPKEVASDGFMMNVTVILDHLCEPFMDTTFSKIDKIDIDYLRRSPRIDIKDETKINADQEQSDAFYSNKVEGTSNFISEVFFLTLAAHHYGSEATNSKMTSLDRDIKYFQKNIVQMEAERPKFANRPEQLRLLEITLNRHIEALEKAMSLKSAIEGVLLDEKMQARSLQFMRYVSVWLLRIASQTDYKPDRPLKYVSFVTPALFLCLSDNLS
jgi:ubiquitin conjugation factor E4 B